MQEIVIVVPVYCEAKNIGRLYERLNDVVSMLPQYSWKYLFVNDGSPDDSLSVLSDLASSDARVSALDLSRNFGKEIALTAGVHESRGADAVICIDADLQHPPEVIPSLIAEWIKGAEVVATIRISTEKQPFLRQIGSNLYYWIMSKISGLDMVSQTTDFRLYDKKVIAAFCMTTERERMFRGIMDWLGFRKVYISFAADARIDGEAGYSYGKLWALAINSITSFSLWPLRLSAYLGAAITTTSLLLSIWMFAANLFGKEVTYTPLALIIVGNTFLMGIILMCLGLVAHYIGNIHTEAINRPLYIIRERFNIDKNEASVDQ